MSKLLAFWFCLLCCPLSVVSQDFSDTLKRADDSAREAVRNYERLTRSRPWKDATGKHEIRATFVRFDVATCSVVLRISKGKEISVSLSKLGSDERTTASKIVQLQDELIGFATKRNKELAAELGKLQAEKQKLLVEIKRLSAYEPSNALATDDGTPIVTAKRLEVFGAEYVGKQVKMTNGRFQGISDTWVDNLHLEGDWAGFNFKDSKGDLFQFAFVRTDMLGEFLLSLDRNQKLNVLGTVVTFDGPSGSLAILVSKIEKIE